MLRRLLATEGRAAPVAARLALAVVMFPHGAQKVLGWFGGRGLGGTLDFFTETLHIPVVFALLAVAAEFLGSLGLFFGLLGRVAAFGIAVNMVVAVIVVHASNGFFMNWSGNKAGEGFEYHLLALGLAVSLMITGSGALSLDRLLTKRRKG